MKTIKLWITNDGTSERHSKQTSKLTSCIPWKMMHCRKIILKNDVIMRTAFFYTDLISYVISQMSLRARKREIKKNQINSKSNFHRITCNVCIPGTVAKMLLPSFYILLMHCDKNPYSIVFCRVMKYTISRHIHNILYHCKYSIPKAQVPPQQYSLWLTKEVSNMHFFALFLAKF